MLGLRRSQTNCRCPRCSYRLRNPSVVACRQSKKFLSVTGIAVGKSKRQSRRRTMKALTPEEVLKVLKIASESKRNHAMILLGYRHGMRASEVCELRLSDLDLKNGQITINRKKGSLKTVQPLSDMPGQPLLSEKRVVRAWLGERRDPSNFVFTSQKGGKLDRTQFFRIFQSIAEQADLPKEK